jgi:biopolymer transport protein ExbD
VIEFERTRQRSINVELTPLIDVVFQLLVFFLLTSALMAQAIPVDLPQASTGKELQQVVTVTLDKNGKLYLDDTRLERDSLRENIQRVTRGFERGEVRAVIAADGSVPHERVVDVIDVLRKQGIHRVGFQVSPRQVD